MLRIGLTGGIASGKSAAAAVFAELGVPSVKSDMSFSVQVPHGGGHI